jgi:hypothetical protein
MIKKMSNLQPPTNTSLPFIAYGIFRPGDISYLLIKDFVKGDPELIKIQGEIKVRDGVKIFSGIGNKTFDAYLIQFTPSESNNAYKVISNKEPDNLYSWRTINVEGEKCNVLEATDIHDGSLNFKEATDIGNDFWTIDQRYWEDAFEFIYKEIISLINPEEYSHTYKIDFTNLKSPVSNNENLFRIQQNYLFLWSMIERFSYYRFGGEKSTDRIKQLFTDFSKVIKSGTSISQKVSNFSLKKGEIFSTETLRMNEKIENGEINFYFYYSIRNNMVHSLKTMNHDVPRTFNALIELFFLFKHHFEVTKLLCHELREDE